MAAHFWQGIVRYFSLRLPGEGASLGPVAPEGAAPATAPEGETVPAAQPWLAQDTLWLVLVYLAQVLGVVAKEVYDDIGARSRLHVSATSLVLGFIVSAVTFPTVYSNLQRQSSRAMRLFMAFQSGFFWQSVLANVTPGR